MRIYPMLIFTLAMQIVTACDVNSRKTAESLFWTVPDEIDTYNFKKPDAKYFLPSVLEEVSALSYAGNGLIACVQDEEGKVFLYNHKTQRLERTIRFEGSGDFEGVEVVGDDIYAVKSNGTLYKFKLDTEEEKVRAKEIKTPLSKSNDVEGLAYDPKTEELILACKGDGDLEDDKVKGRAFYRYEVDDQDFKKKPLFNITRGDIKRFLESQIDFEYEENRINFRPSGIALHPKQDLFYIIASTGKLLLIVDKDGKIKGSVPIDPRLLGQPEGICFAPNGDLFISSEGQGDKGYILKFNMR